MYLDRDSARKRGLVYRGGHLPYNASNVSKAKALRREMTPEEKKLWFGFLRDFKYRVLRQRPIDHYIADFYCPKLKLIIEADGAQHKTEKARRYDAERNAVFSAYGVQVLRFENKEILENFPGVCMKICTVEKEHDAGHTGRPL